MPRPDARLARAREDDAGQLDRQERGRALRVPARHSRRSDGKPIGDGRMYVFTTRADTIMGVTFCAVAAEHPLAAHAARSNPALAAFIDECRRGSVMEADLATMEKKGMPTGLSVTHPLTGEKVEVWVGNYVLMGYGDGAVMGVPAHDERDFAFAQKYGLAIKAGRRRRRRDLLDRRVAALVRGQGARPLREQRQVRRPRLRGGRRRDRRRPRRAGPGREADDVPAARLGHLAPALLGHADPDRPLRRRAATCRCPTKDLPVVLPEDCVPDGSGNPLAKRADFVDCACPKCGKPRERETDTMDTFVDSSWYYMRYTCPDAPTMVDARNDYWMPMDQYIGGIEHAILHLLYARFWTKVMRDMGLVKFDEPFTRLLTQGMVLNHIYFRRNDEGRHRLLRARRRRRRCTTPTGRIVGATLKADGAAGRVRRRRHDVEVQEQRRRPAGA